VSTPWISPVFVGRSPESARLDEALRDAGTGTPRTLLIGGEAGVGKTRLLGEFLDRAADQGAIVAPGACVELGAEGLPFAPASAALRALARELGPELAQAVAGREQDIAWLLPDLATGPVKDGEVNRPRLFEMVLSILEQLSAERTIVLAFEDLHWADGSTRELLGFLIRLLRTGRILIIGTVRIDALERRHPLRGFLAGLERLHGVTRFDLGRLTRPQVAAQLTGILGGEPSRSLVQQIYAKSEGNAFFVEELARSARDGQLTGLSETLRDLLLVRTEQLPAGAQEIVRLAAVAGSTVPHRLLAEAAAAPGLDEALRAAVSAHILVPEPDGYRFRHALQREAVRDDLLPGERTRLHAALAVALAAQPGLLPADEQASRTASYWYHADRPDQALPAVLAAAEAARGRYAYGEQLRMLERALELWDRVPDAAALTGRTRLDVLSAAVPAGRQHNAVDTAYELAGQALELIDEQAEPRRAAWLWVERSRLLRALMRSDGMAELTRAQELLGDEPPSEEHARLLGRIARDRMIDTPNEAAAALARQGLSLIAGQGLTSLESDLHKVLGIILTAVGKTEEGFAEVTTAVRLAEATGDPESLCSVLGNQSSLLEGVGRHRAAVDIARTAKALADKRGLSRNVGAFIIGNLAESMLSLGEWTELESFCDTAFEIDPRPLTAGHLERLLTALDLARGNTDKAAARLEQGRVPDAAYVERQYRIPFAHMEIAVARARGDISAVRGVLTRQTNEGFPTGTQRYAWPLLVEAASAENESGTPDPRAVADIRTAGTALPVACPLDEAWRRTLDAELADTDPELWTAAVEAWAELEQPYTRARVALRCAQALLAAGRREEAAPHLAGATATATRLSAAPLLAALDQLTRRAGLAAPDGQPAPYRLTPRETDVLRLLAEGRTNRQIAEELYISAKTASVHVSNILAKLEVSGRGEAAALAHRLQLL
jgi:DNA-binding CsgD family transcriptional regulator